jgi:hypothetical protein
MRAEHKTTHALIRVFAFFLTAVLVVVLVQAIAHSHANGESGAKCQLCQTAHVGVAPTVASGGQIGPLPATGRIRPYLTALVQEVSFEDNSSRAPPSPTV